MTSDLVERCLMQYHDLPSHVYSVIELFLKRLNLFQLKRFVEKNPHLKCSCDGLFTPFCYNDFQISPQLSFIRIKHDALSDLPHLACKSIESWCELYELLEQHRQYRLKRISSEINRNNANCSSNARKTMLIDNAPIKKFTQSKSTNSIRNSGRLLSKAAIIKKSKTVTKMAPLMKKCLNLRKQFNQAK